MYECEGKNTEKEVFMKCLALLRQQRVSDVSKCACLYLSRALFLSPNFSFSLPSFSVFLSRMQSCPRLANPDDLASQPAFPEN